MLYKLIPILDLKYFVIAPHIFKQELKKWAKNLLTQTSPMMKNRWLF